MKKKLVSLILIIALCASFLSGCILFEKSNKNDYAQVVARISNVEIGTEEKPEKFSKDITKYDLIMAYVNYGQSTYQGAGIQASLDNTLDSLITKELVLARYQRLVNNGDLVLTDAQKAQDYNKAWKAIYDYCDQQIDSIELSLYSNTPQKGSASGETQYPLNTMVAKIQEDAQEKNDENYVPEPFRPDPLNVPKADDTSRLNAVKSFMIEMIRQIDAIKLTKAEEALLQADKDFINNNANKAKIYEKIMGNGKLDNAPVSASSDSPGFFCVRRLVAQSQFDQVKYERIQEYFNKSITVSDAEVQTFWKDTLEYQKVSYTGNLETYYNAAKDTTATPFIFYHPTKEVFYVKHILVPFSDEQKAKITAYGNGHTEAEKLEYRNQMANQIMSYQHTRGYDDTTKGLFTMKQIYDDVWSSIPKGKHKAAEEAFNNLIFKYNTDTGIFNNELGYIMPPKNKGIASGYMKEFELGAYELYEKHNPGDFLERYAVTDYGVHLMYYSSNTGRFYENGKNGTVSLDDWTSPLELQRYRRAVYDYILENRQNQNFDLIQKQIANEYTKDESETYVKKYASRYDDLVKSAQQAADASGATDAANNPGGTSAGTGGTSGTGGYTG